MSKQRLKGWYAITDETWTPDPVLLNQAQQALQAGVRILQYRNKSKSDDEVEALCRALQKLCTQHQATFILNDRVHLAKKINADGVHIGGKDMSVAEARAYLGEDFIIGVSCYGDLARAAAAEQAGASYLAFGAFFPSPTKPQAAVVPFEVIRKARAQSQLPIAVIGGITAENLEQFAAYPVDMYCSVTAIFRTTNIAKAVQTLQATTQTFTASNAL